MNKEKPPKGKQQKTKPKKHNKKTKTKQNPNTHEMNKNNIFVRPTQINTDYNWERITQSRLCLLSWN